MPTTPDDVRPVYFDCDTGIDDSLALLLLLSRPEVRVAGIGTVSGNIDSATAARNTLDLLALAGDRETPVAVGAADFLAGGFSGHGFDGGARHVHGENGIGGVALPPAGREPIEEDAADLLVRLARRHAGALEIIAIGPLTNLALALEREPRLPELVARVTIMGGAAAVAGNISPAAEANIANDPEAAAAVFAAPWALTTVGLDVTLEHRLMEEDREALLAGGVVARTIGEMLDHYFDFYVRVYGERCAALHDPLAVAIATGAARASVAPTVRAEVDTTRGPDRGRTVYDLRGRLRGYPPVDGAHVTVVLALEEPFAPVLREALLGCG